MTYPRETLQEAGRQIGSTIRKLEQTLQTLEAKEEPKRYRSQITLVRRRIQAFTIAQALIQRELAGSLSREEGTDSVSAADE